MIIIFQKFWIIGFSKGVGWKVDDVSHVTDSNSENVEQLRKNSEKSQANLAKPFNRLPTVYLLYTSPWLQRPKHKHKHLRNKPFKTVI